jgi:hypothetical protein
MPAGLDFNATRALHWVARVALLLQPPRRARSIVRRVGAALPPFASVDDAKAASDALGGSGTCLTRALAISARLPGSEVVIGVDPRRSARIVAHAWVALGTEVVGANVSNDGTETIARM